MRRVVVTGMGIVSSLGNNKQEVLESLKTGRSGIKHSQEYADLGMRSHVHGPINLTQEEIEARIDRKTLRFMGNGAAYAYLAMEEAIADAGLTPDLVSNPRTGLIVGAGGTSTESMTQATDTFREKGIRRVGPYMVTKTMSNGVTCLPCHAVPDQGRQLCDFFGLRHQRTLHRQCRRTDSTGQAGHHFRGRCRGGALDHDDAVRRDGCALIQVQRHA